MKRPEKVVIWPHVERKETGFLNHLEKPLFDYTIKLPSWIGLAYRLNYVKVEVHENVPPFIVRNLDHKEWRPYVNENWMKKLTTMRKLNHNYMQVFTLGRDDPKTRELTTQEYNEYRRELRELNEKYGIGTPTKSDSFRSTEAKRLKVGIIRHQPLNPLSNTARGSKDEVVPV